VGGNVATLGGMHRDQGRAGGVCEAGHGKGATVTRIPHCSCSYLPSESRRRRGREPSEGGAQRRNQTPPLQSEQRRTWKFVHFAGMTIVFLEKLQCAALQGLQWWNGSKSYVSRLVT
jgi:hypothetical protein